MPGDIIILQKCTKNHDHMLYCSCDMARDRCNCYFSFWAIFCSFNPLTAQKIKRKKKKKNPVRYHHFTHVYQKLRSDDACFLRYDAQQTDRQTDGRTDRWMDRQMDKKSDIQSSQNLRKPPSQYGKPCTITNYFTVHSTTLSRVYLGMRKNSEVMVGRYLPCLKKPVFSF